MPAIHTRPRRGPNRPSRQAGAYVQAGTARAIAPVGTQVLFARTTIGTPEHTTGHCTAAIRVGGVWKEVAPAVRYELTTKRLTVARSTTELRRNGTWGRSRPTSGAGVRHRAKDSMRPDGRAKDGERASPAILRA